jgi:hypothetical protein
VPRYIVTVHRRLDGVALSKPGHWGGRRFTDEAAAESYARADAGKLGAQIERETR